MGRRKGKAILGIFFCSITLLVHVPGSLTLLAMDILPSSGFFWLQNIRGKSVCAQIHPLRLWWGPAKQKLLTCSFFILSVSVNIPLRISL